MRESYEGDEPVRDDLQLGVLAGEGDEPVLRNALTPPRPLPQRSRSCSPVRAARAKRLASRAQQSRRSLQKVARRAVTRAAQPGRGSPQCLVNNWSCPSLTPPPETLNVPDVLGLHHARAELTYGAVWMR